VLQARRFALPPASTSPAHPRDKARRLDPPLLQPTPIYPDDRTNERSELNMAGDDFARALDSAFQDIIGTEQAGQDI